MASTMLIEAHSDHPVQDTPASWLISTRQCVNQSLRFKSDSPKVNATLREFISRHTRVQVNLGPDRSVPRRNSVR